MNPNATNEIKIFLTDDHKLLRESLELLLSQEDDFQVVGQSDNGINLENIFIKDTPDVLLMDISMPKRNGFDTARAVKKIFPDVKIIFLTMHKSEEMLAEAFHSGCSGYILSSAISRTNLPFCQISERKTRSYHISKFHNQTITYDTKGGFL